MQPDDSVRPIGQSSKASLSLRHPRKTVFLPELMRRYGRDCREDQQRPRVFCHPPYARISHPGAVAERQLLFVLNLNGGRPQALKLNAFVERQIQSLKY